MSFALIKLSVFDVELLVVSRTMVARTFFFGSSIVGTAATAGAGPGFVSPGEASQDGDGGHWARSLVIIPWP